MVYVYTTKHGVTLTTGTKAYGGLVWTPTDVGPGYTGYYQIKTWTGTDRPKANVGVYDAYHRFDEASGKFEKNLSRRKLTEEEKRAPHPYSMTAFAKADGSAKLWVIDFEKQPDPNYHYKWASCTTENAGFGVVSDIPAWDDNHELRLIGKLREKIAGSGFNAGVAFAESDQAIRLIHDSFHRMRNGYNALKRGNVGLATRYLAIGPGKADNLVRGARETSRELANRYLEYAYGVKPLVNDIVDAVQFLHERFMMPPWQRYQVQTTLRGSYPARAASLGGTYKNSAMLRRVRIIAYLKTSSTPVLSGIFDAPSVVWERTPWSFVVDWAIPIGQYLSALTTDQALSGTFVRTEKTLAYARSPISGIDPALFDGGVYLHHSCTVDRTISSVLNVPLPVVKGLVNIATAGHALNSIALLTQQVARSAWGSETPTGPSLDESKRNKPYFDDVARWARRSR